MRITLLRHGKPAYELKGLARAEDLGEITKSYDLAGIADSPPKGTVAATRGDLLVVCSHLVRSVESARALGLPEVHLQDSLFCETAIPYFRSGTLSLPIGVWLVVLRVLWVFGFSRNGESLLDTRARARRAATRLVELAEQYGNVLLVGHGFINHFIAQELRKLGWHGPSKPGRGFWAYGVYERTTS
ncbi:hypothetical protein B447_10058 [Thauera sp. 27]|uniref:histidine phosphatase family protein n=1 Tax=Thauera sp. 27 TaxID=305700 RepID=UPI0002CEA0DC|nr:histidine phosphatase family protein [Thauera sp. 27]ENO81022.1 hypothetical protein B447_10058 [Thauera sp. 27]